MAHVIAIAEEAYQALVDAAHDTGKTPQQILEEWLLRGHGHPPSQSHLDTPNAAIEGYDPAKDPLAPFLGAFETDAPDTVTRHDHYLAETYADPHIPR